MTSNVLIESLEKAQGKRDGDVIELDEDSDVTLFATLGNQTLTIDKLQSVECGHEIVVATTRKNDRFILAYEDVRALRIGRVRQRAGLHPMS